MSDLPTSLEETIDQAIASTKAAIEDGVTRLQVEMVIPELKQQPIAERFLGLFEDLGINQFKVLFPDAGAAALAKRDWNEPDFTIRGINEIQAAIDPDDDAILVVNPSAVEVQDVEKLCNEAQDRPVIILNPALEDVSVVGIGYAARQLRERFLSTLTSCYYYRPLEDAAVLRRHPGSWQVWQDVGEKYELQAELPERPSSEELDRILYGGGEDETSSAPKPKKSLLGEVQKFLRALSQ
ncbi:DUF1995 family protein [Leptothoe kymatousa]|uniref:DUF1995 family protein n=1 Tax=Leptothoe kymatousa TAU-MAC 1615 TaxID=2364775 RepID=A0ABS5Y5Q9_9CYAN|nr:DUF1995 family protein [Leptothoe kymatousa]MBT9313136.1 DUF1995 family protein [Leptothoe kymatousa TAU-MAC 1615]